MKNKLFSKRLLSILISICIFMMPVSAFADENETGTQVTPTFTLTGEMDFRINDSEGMVNYSGSGDAPADYTYTYDNSGNVTFLFQSNINTKYTSIVINDNDYTSQLPTSDEDLLNACIGQFYEFSLSVPYSETYNIAAQRETGDDFCVVGNFLRQYNDSTSPDSYINNGKVEIVNVTYNGSEFSSTNSSLTWESNSDGGSAVLPAGAVVTVRLVPEPGYQLTRFNINDLKLKPQTEASTFTFEVKKGNFHLGAEFTKVDDVVMVADGVDVVTAGTVTLDSGVITAENGGGTAMISVDNSTASESDFESGLAEGYKVSKVLDIKLNQIWNKIGLDNNGNELKDEFWSEEREDLGEKYAAITLDLDGIFKNVQILHKKLDGTIEKLSSTFENGKLSFSTSSFSDFAITAQENSSYQVGFNGGTVEVNGDPIENPWEPIELTDTSNKLTFSVRPPSEFKGETPIVRVETIGNESNCRDITVAPSTDGLFSFEVNPSDFVSDDFQQFVVFIWWNEYDKLGADENQIMVKSFVIHGGEDGNGQGAIQLDGSVESKKFNDETKNVYNDTTRQITAIVTPETGNGLWGVKVTKMGENTNWEPDDVAVYGYNDTFDFSSYKDGDSYKFTFDIESGYEYFVEAEFMPVDPGSDDPGSDDPGSDDPGSDDPGSTPTTPPTPSYPRTPSGGSTEPKAPENPTVNGKEQTWNDAAKDIENAPKDEQLTIDLNGGDTLPKDVVMAIAKSNAKVEIKIDSVFSLTLDGADLDENDAPELDLSIIRKTVSGTDDLRGTVGTGFTIADITKKAKLNINFKAAHAGEFANLYKKVDGKLVFVDNVKIDENGSAIGLEISQKGEYVVMLGKYSDLNGDMDNDGILNAKDALAVLKDSAGLLKGNNPLVSDMDGNGIINAKDALIILKKAAGLL